MLLFLRLAHFGTGQASTQTDATYQEMGTQTEAEFQEAPAVKFCRTPSGWSSHVFLTLKCFEHI